ncbi:MAG: 3'(2'),5'-bisphosphate nucleotidase CysQ [Pseudomonadota bacterium]
MKDVAREAGALAKSYFERPTLRTWDKSEDQPVSEADLAVNELIRRRLLSARSNYGWLSEESTLADHRRDQARVFVVDPIDGTRAFLSDKPDWCIGLSVVEEGEPVCGVVYAPVEDKMYDAGRGLGARLNDKQIATSERQTIQGCRMVAHAGMFSHPAWPEPWPEMDVSRPHPNATLLRMCWVAGGEWDATLTLARKSDWDLAPAAIIVAEAGGVATTHLGEPYNFNRTIPAQRSLLAAGKPLHSLLHARVKGVRLPDPH